jgi:HPt (histidine-containing phosphotransfer) domain-containing protein
VLFRCKIRRVVDNSAIDTAVAKFLEDAYSRLKQGQQSVIYCLERHLSGELPKKLVGQILFHPLDREELADAVAETLGLSLLPAAKEARETGENFASKLSNTPSSTEDSTLEQENSLESSVRAIWEKFKDKNLGRLKPIDQASDALLSGILSQELRQVAAKESHKLAGSLGTFGFAKGSSIARQIEELLQPEVTLDSQSAKDLQALVMALHQELEQDSAMLEKRSQPANSR